MTPTRTTPHADPARSHGGNAQANVATCTAAAPANRVRRAQQHELQRQDRYGRFGGR